MTKLSPLVVAALVAVPFSASASVLTVGGGYARSCYLAAVAKDVGPQAMEACNSALIVEALTPQDHVATLVNRGILYLNRADVKRATRDFDEAITLNPNEPEAWLNKAILNVRYGDAAEALPLAQKALDLKTRRPALAYFVRGIAHEDMGNLRAAYRDLQRARALEPKWNEPVVELRRFKVRQL